MNAIVYTTNTGSTERYAKLLAEQTGLSAYSLSEAKRTVPAGAQIIYLGWIMASTVKGYTEAAKRYELCAVCAVGMGQTGTQTELIREKNHIPQTIPLFTLQGNFSVGKLHGMYRLMMNVMIKAVNKGLGEKTDRTPEEDAMLEMIRDPRERVSAENLKAVLEWYRNA